MKRYMVIVDRRIYNIKHEYFPEAVELVKTELAAMSVRDDSLSYRFYIARIGIFHQFAIEWEFENLAEQEKF